MSFAVWRSGSSGTPSLAAGAPASASSRWSELPVALSRSQVTSTLRCSGRFEDRRLHVRARSRHRRAQLEARAATDLVEGEGEADVGEAVRAPEAVDEGARAEVVGLPGVGPLLGAGRHEPRVALRRLSLGQGGREGDERPDARRVVVGAGGGRDGVGVRHDDDQAPRGGVADADDVARRPLARDGEALEAGAQAGVAEALRDFLVGAAFGGRARGARALGRQRPCEAVGLGRVRRGGRGRRARGRRDAYCGNEGGEHRTQRMSPRALRRVVTCACCSVAAGAPPWVDARTPDQRAGSLSAYTRQTPRSTRCERRAGCRRPVGRPLPR